MGLGMHAEFGYLVPFPRSPRDANMYSVENLKYLLYIYLCTYTYAYIYIYEQI